MSGAEADQSGPVDFKPLPFLTVEEKTVPWRYKVYESATKFVIVEAETAAAAYKASGITEPVRIAREISAREMLIDRKRLLESNSPAVNSGDAAAPPPTS